MLLQLREYFVERFSDSACPHEGDIERRYPAEEFGDSNVFSSERKDQPGKHALILDIDHPCELIPSSTPGHFHLYVDVAMDWVTYSKLLIALMDAGVIEEGYAMASLARKGTYLRKPGVLKETPLDRVKDNL